MSCEVHVRFCEGLGLQCPGLLTRTVRPVSGGIWKMLPEHEHAWNAKGQKRRKKDPMPARCYERARAEAAVTCCTLAG